MKNTGGFLITRIKQVGGRVFDRILSQKKIDVFNGAQGRILYVLWQDNGVPISELSRQTGLATTTLTSMLDRMETADLIYRDRGDRNAKSEGFSMWKQPGDTNPERDADEPKGIYYQEIWKLLLSDSGR